jgi:hypothetical protein
MKGIITISMFAILFLGLTGCYTIPRHFAEDEEYQEVIIYYPVPIEPYDPCPVPDPPTYNPPVHNPQPIIRQPEPPRNDQGYRDQVRDPIRRDGNRGDIESKTRGRS